jgi:hypothetical protein
MVDRLEGGFSPPLKVVLSKLVEEHAHVMNRLVSNRQDRFVGRVINILKYIQTRDPELYSATSHGAGLYWTMQKLRFLFKAWSRQGRSERPQESPKLPQAPPRTQRATPYNSP